MRTSISEIGLCFMVVSVYFFARGIANNPFGTRVEAWDNAGVRFGPHAPRIYSLAEGIFSVVLGYAMYSGKVDQLLRSYGL